MIKSKVALVRCSTYTEEEVFSALERGMELLRGMAEFIQPGEKIVLKPNVLVGDKPDKAVGPHPSVFKAAARLALQVSSQISYGDSPGFGRPAVQMKKNGLGAAAEALNIPLADFENGREVQFKDSPFTKQFILANGVLDADGLISIAKFKTHGLMRITGAVKNQFGCIPGMNKPEFHIKLPSPLDFGKMLVALNLYLRPRLFIVDGITAMEGNGPRGGSPVPMNVLLISSDPVALDAVICRMIDLNPEYAPTMKPGMEWNLGTYLEDEIELAGDPLGSFINKNFWVARSPVKAVTNTTTVSFLRNLISPRPVIDPASCTYCGTCVSVCPAAPKAVDWHDGKKPEPPTYKYERCIRCFCCQEICPEQAISVAMPVLGKLLRKS